ncbi:hypothetical protein FI667_g15008, partial [Globisporangium splendens]
MASDAGWLEVEQTLTAMELPPVPPTSDPQRLLSYVVNILPKYTEMEMLSTHLRLYASTLEQEMEQMQSHVRVLTREVDSEREKKQFLERYAAQIVKERNELLHAKGATKHAKKSASGATSATGHFAWHACCKKNTTHTLDMAPSIIAFRGEKLQDAMHQIKAVQDEVRNQEMLRKEMDFLLKKTQREHDSRVVADRKHIQQLERQLLQRSMLHSNLERKLYEVESALAKHDQIKEEEMDALESKLKLSDADIERLEQDNAILSERVKELASECDQLSKKLGMVTESNNSLAERLDQVSEQYESAKAEIESLRSEIELLQSTDVKNVRSDYASRIQKLQQENAAREQALKQEVDSLRQKLTTMMSEVAIVMSDPQRSSTSQRIAATNFRSTPDARSQEALMDISLPLDAEWNESAEDGSISLEEFGVGLSLSRSQLSELSSSVSRQQRVNGEARAERNLFLPSKSSHRSGHSRHRETTDEVIYEENATVDVDGYASEVTDASFLNWESFIDSPSECATPEAKRTKRMDSSVYENEARFGNGDSAVEHDLRQAMSRLDDMQLTHSILDKEQRELLHSRSGPLTASQQISETGSEHGMTDFEYFQEDEEKDEEKQEDLVGDLAQELRQMLSGFEQKRIEEEQKAAMAENALQRFQKMCQETPAQ